jgi:hypothetical protein
MFARVRGSSSKTSQVVFDPLSDPVAQEALKLLFAKEGNYVQVHAVSVYTYVALLNGFVMCCVHTHCSGAALQCLTVYSV